MSTTDNYIEMKKSISGCLGLRAMKRLGNDTKRVQDLELKYTHYIKQITNRDILYNTGNYTKYL